MKDLRTILFAPLVEALQTATGIGVYTVVPSDVAFPYIYISDFYQKESGPKDSYDYDVELLIQIRYKGLTSIKPLADTMDSIMSLLNNGSPFDLEEPYKIEQCLLISNTDTVILTETGPENIGLIRINFLII